MQNKILKRGYSTGVHSSIAFSLALEAVLIQKDFVYVISDKMDNDDLDVTKGCEIIVSMSYDKHDLNFNKTKQNPHVFTNDNNTIEIYAGLGVGVVSKKGLKIAPHFPAINPAPLQCMKEIFFKQTQNKQNSHLYCTISVSDGELLAKQTANEKVGVLGGISILGTTGFVKPISSLAYLDSIQTEINFAKVNENEALVFTLGNSALKLAQKKYKDEQIIEVGNFVYDALSIANKLKVKKIIFLCGIGKMTKVSQGFKNTHNRFGVIDFDRLKLEIKSELLEEVNIQETLTVKGLSEQLEARGKIEEFYTMICKKANKQIKKWFFDIQIEAKLVEDKEVKQW